MIFGKAESSILPLSASVIIQLSMGMLYGWSVLLIPLEKSLNADRTEVSLAYSISFIFLTVGSFVTHRLLQWLPTSYLALVITFFGAIGLAIAGYGSSIAALVVGFGVIFGFSTGVCYFLAMSVAGISSPFSHSVSLSISIAAFALGGVLWPPIFSYLIDKLDVHSALEVAALILLITGTISFILLLKAKTNVPGSEHSIKVFQDLLTDRPRIIIALLLGFVFLGFASLMVMGHAASMAAEWGTNDITLGPVLANLGYIAGAIVAGHLSKIFSGRSLMFYLSLLAGIAMLVVWIIPNSLVGLIVLTIIGISWGAAAAIYPVTVTAYYGIDSMPRIYRRLTISYGSGGLLGPTAAGAIFDSTGSYNSAIVVAGICAMLAAISHAFLPTTKKNLEK